MGLYVEFDVSDYGYVSQVQGDIADMFPVFAVMDFAPACEAFVVKIRNPLWHKGQNVLFAKKFATNSAKRAVSTC